MAKGNGSKPESKKIISINEDLVQAKLSNLVKDTVEDTLNGLLDAEADQLCGAKRYQRSSERVDTRAGHYSRSLETKAGTVALKVPKLRHLPFETAIIERYRRREASVEEALIEITWPECRYVGWRISPRHSGARTSPLGR